MFRFQRFRQRADGGIDSQIFHVEKEADIPAGWYEGEFEARQAATAPQSAEAVAQQPSAPAASDTAPRRPGRRSKAS